MDDSIELSVQAAADILKGENPPALVDVREEFEREICKIPGSVQLTEELAEEMLAHWDKNAPIIFSCHHGGRSRGAAEYFQSQGFSQVKNLSGGIDAWSMYIDPSVPRY
jgi:monothiol glutaredoxin